MPIHPNLEKYASEPPTDETLKAYKRHLDAHNGQGSIGHIPPAHQALVWERFYGELEEGNGNGGQATAAPTEQEESPKLNRSNLQSVPRDVNDRTPVVFVKDRLPSYPAFAPPELRIPKGYTISQWYTGNIEIKHSAERGADGSVEGQQTEIVPIPFAHSPIIITARYEDANSGIIYLRVDWMVGGKWKYHIARKSVWSSASMITQLADVDFPVSSDNQKKVIKYLRDFEFYNMQNIVCSQMSQQQGWTPDLGGYLYGDDFIPTDATTPDGHTTYLPMSENDRSITKGYHSKGSMECWRDAVEIAKDFDLIMLGLYAGFCSPLLEPMSVNNFAVDFASMTSQGKTTALKFIASIYGPGDERHKNSIIRTFLSSNNYLERLASIQSHFPMLIDESKLAKTIAGKSTVPELIYMLTSGISRGRATASATGISEMLRWRTVIITTGEHRLVDVSQDGGLAARVISLWGSPFGSTNKETRKAVDSINRLVKMSYGHAGPLWIRYICDHRHVWHVWQDMLHDEVKKVAHALEEATSFGQASRMAEYFALISLAYQIAQPALELPDNGNPVYKCIGHTADEISNTGRIEEAIKAIYAAAGKDQTRFFGREVVGDGPPKSGWLGAWKRDCRTTGKPWEYIAFTKAAVHEILEKEGYQETRSVLRGMAERGYIKLKGGKKPDMYTTERIDGEPMAVVKFTREALTAGIYDWED